jgi:hypothetical protein
METLRPSTPPASQKSSHFPLLVVAIGVVVLLVVGSNALRNGDPEFTLDVAALSAAPSLAAYNALLGFPDSRLPASLGGTSTVDDYLELLGRVEQRKFESQIQSSTAQLRSSDFYLAFRPFASCSVAVFAVDSFGQAERWLPDPAEPEVLLPDFEGGTTHFLPGDSLVVAKADADAAGDGVSFQPGYHLRVGVHRIRVLLAFKQSEIPSTFLEQVDEAIAGWNASNNRDTAAHLRIWLLERGFHCRELTINEP